MRLQVLGIGKLKAGPEKTLSLEYQTRLEGLGRKAGITKLTVTDFAESQSQTASQRQAEEAKLLAGALAPKAFTLVLDERGKPFTSEGFLAAPAAPPRSGHARPCLPHRRPRWPQRRNPKTRRATHLAKRNDLAPPAGAYYASRTNLPGGHHYGKSSLSQILSRNLDKRGP